MGQRFSTPAAMGTIAKTVSAYPKGGPIASMPSARSARPSAPRAILPPPEAMNSVNARPKRPNASAAGVVTDSVDMGLGLLLLDG